VLGADPPMDAALQPPALLAASAGVSRMYADDLAQLDAGMTLYDAFYRGAGTPPKKPIRGHSKTGTLNVRRHPRYRAVRRRRDKMLREGDRTPMIPFTRYSHCAGLALCVSGLTSGRR